MTGTVSYKFLQSAHVLHVLISENVRNIESNVWSFAYIIQTKAWNSTQHSTVRWRWFILFSECVQLSNVWKTNESQ